MYWHSCTLSPENSQHNRDKGPDLERSHIEVCLPWAVHQAGRKRRRSGALVPPFLDLPHKGSPVPDRNKRPPNELLVGAERGVTAVHDPDGQAEANESCVESDQCETMP